MARATASPPKPMPAISGLMFTFSWSNTRRPPRPYTKATAVRRNRGISRSAVLGSASPMLRVMYHEKAAETMELTEATPSMTTSTRATVFTTC